MVKLQTKCGVMKVRGIKDIKINGLGRNSKKKLSQKRITAAARKKLKELFNNDNIKVSCSACFINDRWIGYFFINKIIIEYEIFLI